MSRPRPRIWPWAKTPRVLRSIRRRWRARIVIRIIATIIKTTMTSRSRSRRSAMSGLFTGSRHSNSSGTHCCWVCKMVVAVCRPAPAIKPRGIIATAGLDRNAMTAWAAALAPVDLGITQIKSVKASQKWLYFLGSRALVGKNRRMSKNVAGGPKARASEMKAWWDWVTMVRISQSTVDTDTWWPPRSGTIVATFGDTSSRWALPMSRLTLANRSPWTIHTEGIIQVSLKVKDRQTSASHSNSITRCNSSRSSRATSQNSSRWARARLKTYRKKKHDLKSCR